MNKVDFKKYCLKLFTEGKSISKISKLTNRSRKYITNLIKDDEKYIQIKNNKKIKVYKRKNGSHMIIYIPTTFIEKLGISKDRTKSEYVNVSYNEKDNNIIISKA